MKVAMLYVLVFPLVILGFTGLGGGVGLGLAGPATTPGPTACRRSSTPSPAAPGNNGSAFAGLTANTPFYNTTLGLAMLVGRFLMIIPVLAIAGSMVGKRTVAPGPGDLPHQRPAVRGPAHLGGPHRRGADLLPGAQPGTGRRALRGPHRKDVLT